MEFGRLFIPSCLGSDIFPFFYFFICNCCLIVYWTSPVLGVIVSFYGAMFSVLLYFMSENWVQAGSQPMAVSGFQSVSFYLTSDPSIWLRCTGKTASIFRSYAVFNTMSKIVETKNAKIGNLFHLKARLATTTKELKKLHKARYSSDNGVVEG